MRKKWTEEEYYKLSKMYYNNKTDKEIAKEFNTSETNIYSIRVSLGLTGNSRVDWNEEEIRNYVIKQFNKASSMNQLSSTLKLANSTMLRVLRKYKKEGYIDDSKIKLLMK